MLVLVVPSKLTAKIDVEEYSNPEDFPVNFARKMVRMLLVTVVLRWTAKAKSIAAAIRRVVEEEQVFLDPHLTVQDVATRCGFNRTYVAGIFKSEFGGFFRYVNTLRLRYADEYQAAHPTASVAELADAAGFGSRQSYYKVKKELEQQAAPEIIPPRRR